MELPVTTCWRLPAEGGCGSKGRIVHNQLDFLGSDTALTPDSGPSAGSRQQVVTGNSIKAGCDLLDPSDEETRWQL